MEYMIDAPALDDDAPLTVQRSIRDGSQCIQHDGYDVQTFAEALDTFGQLRKAVDGARKRLITAPALFRDLFWSFHKRSPIVQPNVPLTSAYELNRQILDQIMGTVEWKQVREAGTPGDLLNSALAIMGVAQKALDALDEETVKRINHLHALESGAEELFARAEALEDLAQQAQGDRARQLFAQAKKARSQAERNQKQSEQEQNALDATQEAREDAVRRAARQGLNGAEHQIDATAAALAAYGSGQGGGSPLTGDTMTAKDKLQLAGTVAKSNRLKQIAALCGRMTRIALDVQKTRVKHPPDEITSITIGDDLAHILPAELSLLSEPLLEDLFFLKMTEKRLAQYDLHGRDKEGQGPIIVALDSSGSMSYVERGATATKEVWSKAVTLALLAIARLQRRDMAVMHFSSPGELATYHFPKGQSDYSQVIACCDHFYAGGTVYEPWMQEALRLVRESRYNKADVICISDGQASVSTEMEANWNQMRSQRGMRAYSVLIGERAGMGVLARISDAVVELDNLAEDNAALQMMFSVGEE